MNLLLFILAFLLVAILTPFGFVATIIKSFIYWNKGVLKEYFFNVALACD